MTSKFVSIKFGLIVGIGGGVLSAESDIRLGDVAISQPHMQHGGVVQYDFGKTGEGGKFTRTGFLNAPPAILLNALSKFRSNHLRRRSKLSVHLSTIVNRLPDFATPRVESDILFETTYNHTGGPTCDSCSKDRIVERDPRKSEEIVIHYGTIASGNQVMKDGVTRDKLSSELGGVLCFEMEAAGLVNNFQCLIIRGICDYADSHKNKKWQPYAAATAAACAKELLSLIPPTIVQTSVPDKDLLKLLPSAPQAAFNSYDNQHDSLCLYNTRVDVLKEIMAWANGDDERCIFWLNGMAGTGKSTISRTVAQNFADKGDLGASFFFKRGEGDRGHAGLFIATIATQLVQNLPSLALHVQNAIEADPIISRKALKQQFETLVLQPLRNIRTDQKPSRIVIVIDALDECDREEDVKIMIRLLSQAKRLSSVQLKFFLTSRPELPIRVGFKDISGSYKGSALHEIPEPIIEHDISAFLVYELARIRDDYNKSVSQDRHLPADWPGQTNVQSLVQMAIPLFIFATTICRFVEDRRCGEPEEQLAKVLKYQTKSQESELDATYLPVLDQLLLGLTNLRRDEVVQKFKEVVGTIVILASALSTTSLARLLGISKARVDNTLDLLHSVLSIPSNPDTPVRLLHLSFRNFLLDTKKRETNPFWVDEKDAHNKLATRCLELLSTGDNLREDICNLRTPERPRADVDQQTINSHLPPDIQYACQYWVYHLKESGSIIYDDDQVHNFLRCHFLHWLESLSLIGRLRESIGMINNLVAMIEVRHSLILTVSIYQNIIKVYQKYPTISIPS
jgi:nucleoside phosphorylase